MANDWGFGELCKWNWRPSISRAINGLDQINKLGLRSIWKNLKDKQLIQLQAGQIAVTIARYRHRIKL